MIDGFRIGHHTRDEPGWLTGTTVVFATDGAVGGVDVRGGGPGTRETDLLEPSTLVERVDAVVLTGGSAYGLAAADGVMLELERRGSGFSVGGSGEIVPIVPAAVIFDLGRGGVFDHRPDAGFGRAALLNAIDGPAEPATGSVGAGTGARCGGLRGGFGYAESRLESGVTVAAAVVVNAAGSGVDPQSGRLWSDRARTLPEPTTAERAAVLAASGVVGPTAPGRDAPLNTTIGVLLTDARLSKAQARRTAVVGHDGMARAVAPIHSMLDGDTVFSLASGLLAPPTDPRAALGWFDTLLAGAADVFTAACSNALLTARGRSGMPSYLDLVPGARISG